MKKIIATALCALILCAFCACGDTAEETAVTVQSVQEITGGAMYAPDRFAGIVVAGQTEKIKKDENKKVLEILVAEGDHVNAGDVLFTYDTQAMQFDLDKLRLEKESLDSAVRSAEAQIGELEEERDEASSSEKLEFVLQIEALEADIRENEYNAALKQREIDNAEASMADTEVTASIDGRVMSIREESDGEAVTGTGTDEAFITVMDMDSVRIEGTINELNAGSLAPGMAVMIRSRTDDSLIRSGTVDSIDWENPEQGNDNGNYYYGETDTMTSSSKYPFYITLADREGLMLGQHVYIEPAYGDETKTGLWLGSYWFGELGDHAWLWAESDKGRLEKRELTLGDYDEETDEYQILGGLDASDYIAFPEEGLAVGAAVSRYEMTEETDAEVVG